MITEQIETNMGALFFQVYLAHMQILKLCFFKPLANDF